MNTEKTKIVVATSNEGKIAELTAMFAPLDEIMLLGLADFENIVDVDETGITFAENAILKARGYALQTGNICLADDSGLSVSALDGQPGVFSARYAGIESGFDVKMSALINELNGTASQDRSAAFNCSMALSDPGGKILIVAEGVCSGKIAFSPLGDNGFGYDPIFIPTGYDNSFGELSSSIKSDISHRKMAAEQIFRYLVDFSH